MWTRNFVLYESIVEALQQVQNQGWSSSRLPFGSLSQSDPGGSLSETQMSILNVPDQDLGVGGLVST